MEVKYEKRKWTYTYDNNIFSNNNTGFNIGGSTLCRIAIQK